TSPGVVSFHGALDTPNSNDTNSIRCRVLALHGADDPFVPPKDVAAFEEEMRQAGVDWQLTSYGGAVHSFTDWNAGNDNSKGAAYNEKADSPFMGSDEVVLHRNFSKRHASTSTSG